MQTSFEMSLFDDERTKNKLELMSAIEAMFDDKRNILPEEYFFFSDELPLGTTIRVAFEVVPNAGVTGTKWKELHDRFLRLRDKTSASKTSSYAMDVSFDPYDGIRVHLGTYDIGSWPRHTQLGPFSTETEAMTATEQKIAEAEVVVAEEEHDDA